MFMTVDCLTCTQLPQHSHSLGLVVVSEEDTRTLLVHRISAEDIYQRQGGAPADVV